MSTLSLSSEHLTVKPVARGVALWRLYLMRAPAQDPSRYPCHGDGCL